jgi:hypothetical protein
MSLRITTVALSPGYRNHSDGTTQGFRKALLMGRWVMNASSGYESGHPNGLMIRVQAWLVRLERTHLPHICFHDLRHTAATLLLEAGIHFKVVSEMLEHANVAITMSIYAHTRPAMHRTAAAAMDVILQEAMPDVAEEIRYLQGSDEGEGTDDNCSQSSRNARRCWKERSVRHQARSGRMKGAARGIRTPDPRFRRPMLCSAELWQPMCDVRGPAVPVCAS